MATDLAALEARLSKVEGRLVVTEQQMITVIDRETMRFGQVKTLFERLTDFDKQFADIERRLKSVEADVKKALSKK